MNSHLGAHPIRASTNVDFAATPATRFTWLCLRQIEGDNIICDVMDKTRRYKGALTWNGRITA
jgi:hypothetical protein